MGYHLGHLDHVLCMKDIHLVDRNSTKTYSRSLMAALS